MKTETFFRTTNVKFIKEWTPEQFKAMDKAILKHFANAYLRYSTGAGEERRPIWKFSQLDNILGLAYTSSGVWACYGICNVSAWFDEDNIYKYDYFTIGEDGKFYAVLTDNNENELVIKLK